MPPEPIGNLIRKFRQRAGMSQFDLEQSIDAAFGSLSRIELDKVDPSKETINKIVSVLGLSVREAALLYKLDINDYRELSKSLNNIHLQKTLPDMLQAVIDGLQKERLLIGTAIFLIEGNKLQFKSFGNGWYVKKIRELLGERLNNLFYPLDADYSNSFLKAVKDNEVITSTSLYECIGPEINKRMCSLIQTMVNIKAISVAPIAKPGEKPIGALAFSYSKADTTNEILPIVLSYCDTIAIAIEKF